MVTRGRVLKAEAVTDATTRVFGGTLPPRRGRVLPGRVFDARREADRIVAEAEARARDIVERAERAGADLRLALETEARARAAADVAALALGLAEREAELERRSFEQNLLVARLLAERLLGKALELDPALVVALAREALAEARGAERVTIVAHPDDARQLAARLPELGVGADAVTVRADAARAPGNLRLETDIGVLDAALAPQLERLLGALREVLQRG